MGSHRVERSRTYPVTPAEAFAATLPTPLPRLFSRRYGPLPPIARVTGQHDEWATVGQTRTIHLAGGGTMLEELTEVAGPDRFAYRISRVTGPMKALVATVDGAWEFAPAGTGTCVTWSWAMHPTSPATRPLVRALGRFWQGYARSALEELEHVLVPAGRRG